MRYLVDTDWAIENLHGREPIVSLIGATAISHGLTLLTNNRRRFGRMRGLNIISA